MKIVIDNNIFFSLMKPLSTASYLFSILNSEFFAPSTILDEINKYRSECILKSGLSEEEFEIRKNEVQEKIKIIDISEFYRLIEENINNIQDQKDVPYLALAMHIKANIWSNDTDLKKQSIIKVYTTKELLKFLEY